MPDAKKLSEITNLLAALADADLLYAAEDTGGGFDSAAITGAVLKASLASLWEREIFALDGTDISNKYVTLSRVPLNASTVNLKLSGGGVSLFSVDYTVSGDQVGWNALALDGIVSVGDILEISYL
jgi:hypothetical protein